MIRFAVLVGVSTEPQARDDKLSIPDQIKNCRAFIAANNGIESAGPFIMDGYSRTGYDSLEVAMQEIPPLGEAIHQAMQDKYDILLMDNYDRLGDLGFIVKTRFKKIRKQLHSVRQSGRVTPPNLYDPYSDDSADIQMHVEGIIQTYRINKIRRGWNVGVPDRALTGLHPLSIPFAYKLSAKKDPAIQVPEEAQLVIKMKDLFLAGETLQTICDRANASGVPPRRAVSWTRTVIKRMILNKFYAGFTAFGMFKKMGGRRVRMPRSQWITGVGRHQPLWDEETYTAILVEAERRDATHAHAEVYALSGLLTCASCGQRLHRHGRVSGPYPVFLACRRSRGCVVIEYSQAHLIVAQKVVTELKHHKNTPSQADSSAEADSQLAQLQELRRTVQEGFEAHLYTASEASARIVSIETDMQRLAAQHDRAAQRKQHQRALLQFAEQDIEQLKNWILHDEPTTVNRLLTALCETITITPAYDLQITWR